MPRLDPFAELHPGCDPYATAALTRDAASVEDPELRSYSSGFWGLVPVGARRRPATGSSSSWRPSSTTARRHARRWGRSRSSRWRPRRLPMPRDGAGPLVAICMATHNPPPDLLERQLGLDPRPDAPALGLPDQRRLLEPERFAALQRAVAGDDPAFSSSRSPGRLGFYRNFERALPWRQPRLTTSPSPIRTTVGIRTSCRRSSRRSATRSSSTATAAWSTATAPSSPTPTGALAATTTPTCSRCWSPTRSPARRRSAARPARRCAPVPPGQFAHYHDHWLALVARALGEIAVRRPAAVRLRPARPRGAGARRRQPDAQPTVAPTPARPARAGAHVAHALLRRCVPPAAVRRHPAAALWRPHPALGAPGDGAARRRGQLAGTRWRCWASAGRWRWRAAAETLGAEWMLFCALSWRRLLAATARARPQRRLRLDAVPPPGSGAAADPGGHAGPGGPGGGVEDRAAGPRAVAGGPGAHQPARADDRPGALLRRLHCEVQPGPPPDAGRAPRACRDGRPGGVRCPGPGGGRSRPTAAWTGCSTVWRSPSAASRRRSRSTLRMGSSPRPGGRPISLATPSGGWRPPARGRSCGSSTSSRSTSRSPSRWGRTRRWRRSPTPRRISACSRASSCATTFAVTASACSPQAPTATRARRRLRTPSPQFRRRPSPSWPAAGPGGCCSTPVRSRTPRATCSSWGSWR